MSSDPQTVFLDESGSSGDAIQTGAALDFAGQQIFVLAAIATCDHVGLGNEFARLLRVHGLKNGEIKSATVAHLPRFTVDLVTYLEASESAIFIEVMDKRFLIVATLVNQIVMQSIPGVDEQADGLMMRAALAD